LAGEIKWHYSPPKVRKGSKIEEQPIWHYQGRYIKDGEPVCDGKWGDVFGSLKADGGWKEIEDMVFKINPTDAENYKKWNQKGAPEAHHFFAPIEKKEAA
jgi:hypothetical protein